MSELITNIVPNTVKRCKICGDKAKCYNHNGLSCNPCRLFFNRNISKLDKLKCLKSDKCEIDFVSRKCCPKCRMSKCMAIGLSKIEAKLKTKLETKFENKQKKNLKIDSKNKLSIKTSSSASSKSSKFRLNQYELELIGDIQSKMSHIFENESQLQVIGVATNLVTTVNLNAVYTPRVVKFCKSIPAFCALNSDDQLSTLKRFFFECFLLRIVFDYDYEKKCTYSLVNESGTQVVLMKTALFKGMRTYKKIGEIIGLGYELKMEMQNDTVTRDLTMALLLFQDRENSCSCREFVRYNFTVYSRLLCRYYEHKYSSVAKAKKKYQTLMDKLRCFVKMREVTIEIYNEIGLDKLEKVLIELIG